MPRSPLVPLAATVVLVLAAHVTAQNLTNTYNFKALVNGTNSDGANPDAQLTLAGNTLYGTVYSGGAAGNGTVFGVNIDGSGFTNLHNFAALNSNTNDDGANPSAALALGGRTLYGTASDGGWFRNGTVFAVDIDGTGFRTLHQFTRGSDGGIPNGGLVLLGDTLYGTAAYGGDGHNGMVFAVSTNGLFFTNLHSFSTPVPPDYINNDGANPGAGLTLAGNTLYGTAANGGTAGNGTVFAVNTDGTGFTNLHNFTATVSADNTNNDGADPGARLILSGSTLYGTAFVGGTAGRGTVFSINTNGTAFSTLHSFSVATSPNFFNSDGAYPTAELVLSGNVLYGAASYGGAYGAGTIFAVNTDGSRFRTLYNFSGNDGTQPNAVVLSGNYLYGTSYGGATSGNGAVFSLFVQPQLNIMVANSKVIVIWPTNTTGYTLQFNTNLPPKGFWNNVSATPGVVNGLYAVTNTVSGREQYYRLKSQ